MSRNVSIVYFTFGFGIGLICMSICFILANTDETEAKAAKDLSTQIDKQLDKPIKQTIPEKITLECGSKLLSINFNNNSLTILTTPFEKFDKAVSYDFIVDGKKSTILECELNTR